MCPICLLTSIWLWLGLGSSGGVIALFVKKLRARRARLSATHAPLAEDSASG
jgi:hypothetical protein